MDLLYFVLFVGILIFIHESGHFAFAKVFGVKVLTFSIGFGPKLLRVRGRETEYCLSLLPFGGFVKMLEEGKAEQPILPEDRPRTFEAQALWKRVIIVLAGPAMNVLFPVLLYTSVYLEDREFLPSAVGSVTPGKPADGKLFPGDAIIEIEGTEVTSFPEVQRAVAAHAGQPQRIVVERDGKRVEVVIVPTEEVEVIEPRELELYERVGRIGISPTFAAPVVGVSRPDSPAWRAGLRTFDRITAINGRKVDTFVELAHVLSQNRGDTLVLSYLRPSGGAVLGGLSDMHVLDTGVATLTPIAPLEGASPPADHTARASDVALRTGIESADMFVSFVPEGSSEWQAGLRAGDRIVALDGEPQRMWKAMESQLLREPSRTHAMTWLRDGAEMSGTFQLRKEVWNDDLGQHYERYVFRTSHWSAKARAEMVPNPHPLLYAMRRGLEETVSAVKFVVVGFVRIVQGRVSVAAVSGPITLYDVAGDAGAKGATYFVWAMAVTSVNLGIINLLPVPVLDGGHIVLLLVELVRRKPVSMKTRQMASLAGMLVLITLMALAFKNDVTRKWGGLRGQSTGIFR